MSLAENIPSPSNSTRSVRLAACGSTTIVARIAAGSNANLVLRRISTTGAAMIDGSAITIARTLRDTTWFQRGFITRLLLEIESVTRASNARARGVALIAAAGTRARRRSRDLASAVTACREVSRAPATIAP